MAKSRDERIAFERAGKGWWGRKCRMALWRRSEAESKIDRQMNSEANELQRKIDVANARREEQERTQGKTYSTTRRTYCFQKRHY